MRSHTCGKCGPFLDRCASKIYSLEDRTRDLSPHLLTLQYHESLDLFKAAAADGSGVCILFLGKLHGAFTRANQKSAKLENLDSFKAEIILKAYGKNRSNLQLRVDRDCSKALAVPAVDLHLYHQLDSGTVSTSEIPIESSTWSISAQKLVHVWLNSCLTTHDLCKSDKATTSTAPTRLLSLSDGKIRLVRTAALPMIPQYFTLSHCWGAIEIVKLTQNNIEEFEIDIPENTLCQTFKDAVQITRDLGFGFLWIDSICIIQDDKEDWSREASKMSGVYGGSLLNLAASEAKDGREGLLAHRTEERIRLIQRCRVECSGGDAGMRSWLDCADPWIVDGCLESSPLADRGWVFQERFLAPRTLHFTKTQLYWECRERAACETYQDRLLRRSEKFERQDISRVWLNAITQYSGTQLTLPTDRLVAISGVARWLHSRTGDEYIAGLWRKNLECQLLWDNTDKSRRRHPEELPSWTWASWLGKINLKPTHDADDQKIISVHVEDTDLVFDGNDSYGEVISGKLRLRVSPLITCKIKDHGLRFGAINRNHPRVEFLNGGVAHDHFFVCRSDKSLGFNSDRGGHSLLYLLPILTYSDLEAGPKDRSFRGKRMEKPIAGLVLSSVQGPPSGCFRRVGTFSDAGVYYDWVSATIFTAMDDPKCWADENIYEESAGTFQLEMPEYYVSII